MKGKYQKVIVRSNRQIAADIFQLDLETDVSESVFPGQFVMLQGLAQTSVLPRPFTVYFAQRGVFIRLVFEARGKNTRLYAQLKSGEGINLLGPCGQPAVIGEQTKLAIFVGGGCGLASLHFLAFEASRTQGADLLVASGFRDGDHVFGVKDFESLGIAMEIATEDGSRGTKGTALDLFQEIVHGNDGHLKPEMTQVFTCGPTAMMKQVAACAKAEGIQCFVFLEAMMACGIGDCKGCAIPVTTSNFPKHVCEDGPLFLAEEVNWNGFTKDS